MMDINMYNNLINNFKGNYNVGKLFYANEDVKENVLEKPTHFPDLLPMCVPGSSKYEQNNFCFHAEFKTDKCGLLYLESEIKDGQCPLCGKKLKTNEVVLIEAFINSININFKLDQINFEKNCLKELKEYEVEKEKEFKTQPDLPEKEVEEAVPYFPPVIPIKDQIHIEKQSEVSVAEENNSKEESYDSSIFGAPALVEEDKKEKNHKACKMCVPESVKEEKINKSGRGVKINDDIINQAIRDYFTKRVSIKSVAKKYNISQSALSNKISKCRNGHMNIFTSQKLNYIEIKAILDLVYDDIIKNDHSISEENMKKCKNIIKSSFKLNRVIEDIKKVYFKFKSDYDGSNAFTLLKDSMKDKMIGNLIVVK